MGGVEGGCFISGTGKKREPNINTHSQVKISDENNLAAVIYQRMNWIFFTFESAPYRNV